MGKARGALKVRTDGEGARDVGQGKAGQGLGMEESGEACFWCVGTGYGGIEDCEKGKSDFVYLSALFSKVRVGF